MFNHDKLVNLEAEFEDLKHQLADISILNDPNRYKPLTRRFRELQTIVDAWHHLQKLMEQIDDTKAMQSADLDAEMSAMVSYEIELLANKIAHYEEDLRELLIPSDPNDAKNAIIEIRAGTGG